MASGFSAGGLNPLQGVGIPGPLALMAIESFKLHQAMWAELIEDSGVDFQPKVISVVRVAFKERELDDLTDTHRIFESAGNGFKARWLDSRQLREMEPRIASDSVRALEIHGNAVLSSYRYTLALAQAAEKLGAVIMSGEVMGIKRAGDRVSSVVLRNGEIVCDSVVFATGPWSGMVEGWLGVRVPVEPLKGEMLRMRPTDGRPPDRDFEGAGVSLYHREEGQVWIGATEERKGFDSEPSTSARDKLIAGAARLMPAMADAELVLHTACLRPVTPDLLPIIGPAPGWDNA
ncbi:MAG: FAD-dependent oxidoreductase, partial [Chloroflexi bacterium]|nr:FAD-dependent oxidoreductase [Chloroflexota bacterium]